MAKRASALADNPLDFMTGMRHLESVPAPVAATKSLAPPMVSRDSAPVASAPVVEAKSEGESESLEMELDMFESSVSSLVATEPVVERRRPEQSQTSIAHSAEQRAALHRIGTKRRPYERKDGTRTRQSSLTLSVEMFKRLGLCALETGDNTNTVIVQALNAYLSKRGF